jgi:hypothetical protein
MKFLFLSFRIVLLLLISEITKASLNFSEEPPSVRVGSWHDRGGLLRRLLPGRLPAAQARHGGHPRLQLRSHRTLGTHHVQRN